MSYQILEDFKIHYPLYGDQIDSYWENSPYELYIRFEDGKTLIYDSIDKTIRHLPINSSNITEQERRHEFGIRLRRMMLYKGITQEDLSKMTGITQAMISRYMTGQSSPSFSNVDKICKALRCSMDRLRYTDVLDI